MSALAAVAFASSTVPPAQAAATEPKVSFEEQVLPIFEEYCNTCHRPGGLGNISSSLDLTSYKGLMRGSSVGVAIIPFHADRSPIMRYLKTNWQSNDKNVLRMPPLGPQLSAKDLKTITDWINQGAKNN